MCKCPNGWHRRGKDFVTSGRLKANACTFNCDVHKVRLILSIYAYVEIRHPMAR
jgi:hypothetical protein